MSETSSGTSSRLWREENAAEFQATILAAAEQLDVQPLAVEKDYWVCETLRAIEANHPGEIVFKGGTSLEKLGLIRRFSEDLDLLVIGTYPSNRATENALKAMCATAGAALGAEPERISGGGGPGWYHRAVYLTPPMTNEAGAGSGIAEPGRVMVELGQSGGRNPHQGEPVTSLLARQLADVGVGDGFVDLEPFEVQVLHPGRTLLEKLFRVGAFVADPDAVGEHGWPRIGRQYYDIYALLGDDRVHELLADGETVAGIVDSCIEVSATLFNQNVAVPAGGFSKCPAFDASHEHSERLRVEHDNAMAGLYYGNEAPPTFDQVLERIHDSAAALLCGAEA